MFLVSGQLLPRGSLISEKSPLGRSWAILGTSRHHLKEMFAPSGPHWGDLGLYWGDLEQCWGALDASWGDLASSWGHVGSSSYGFVAKGLRFLVQVSNLKF